MTTFHENLKSIISEVEKFLVETLKKEKLSSASKEHKQLILDKVNQLREEYPQFLPSKSAEDAGKSKQALFRTPNTMRRSTSCSPRTMTRSSSLMMLWKRLSHWDLDKIDDESTRTGGSSNTDSAEDPYSDQGIPDIPASELKDVAKSGYLEKKQKKGLLNTGKLQKRYCVIKSDIFYYYEKEKDKKQKGAFRLTGYEFRLCPDLVKDASKKDLCFEIFTSEKRIYQFIAPSKDDLESWHEAVLKATGAAVFDDDQGEDIYEPIEDPPPEVTAEADDFYSDPTEETVKSPDKISEPEAEPEADDIYEDTDNTLPTSQEPPQQVEPSKSPNVVTQDDLEQDEEYADCESKPPPPIPGRPLPRPPPPTPDSKPPEVPGRGGIPGRKFNLPPPPIPPDGTVSSEPLPPPPPSMDLPPVPTSGERSPRPELKKKKVLPRDQDFENLFYGLWDCKADRENELSFGKGDMILIINRDFDDKSWWVGELKGKYGLVPKNFLTNAYTPATA